MKNLYYSGFMKWRNICGWTHYFCQIFLNKYTIHFYTNLFADPTRNLDYNKCKNNHSLVSFPIYLCLFTSCHKNKAISLFSIQSHFPIITECYTWPTFYSNFTLLKLLIKLSVYLSISVISNCTYPWLSFIFPNR